MTLDTKALEALLPCPLCGGPADFTGRPGAGYHVQCSDCQCKGPWGDYGYQAASDWNRRATPSRNDILEAPKVRAADVALAFKDAGLLSRDGTFAQGPVRDFVTAFRALVKP